MSEICHTRTFPLQVNQCRLDPVLSGCLLAVPLTKTTVGVWDVTDDSSEPLSLFGHKQPVSALAFSADEPKLLCSAGHDFVIVWNVRKCLHSAASNSSQVRGDIILSHPGDVSHACFSVNAARVALCVDAVIKIVNVVTAKVVAELVGHVARVTAAQFCPHFLATLVTISDDRTVIVWDVENFSLIYQSAVLSAAPLISLCMNHLEPHVAIASAAGVVKVFDLAEDKSFRQLCQLDIGKILSKHRQMKQGASAGILPTDGPLLVTRGATMKRDLSLPGGGDSNFSTIEICDAVHSVMYAYHSASKHTHGERLAGSHGAVGEMLSAESPVLVVVASHCMLQVDTKTLQVLAFVDLTNPMPSSYAQDVMIGAVGLAGTSQTSPSQLVAVVGTQFESRMHSMLWSLSSYNRSGTDMGTCTSNSMNTLYISPPSESCDLECDNELSMVANRPLSDKSPLKSELVPTISSGASFKAATSHKGSLGGKKPDPMNQPLTFRSKVKSSGYTQAPRTNMFKPKTNISRSKSVDMSNSLSKSVSLVSRLASQEYASEAGPPCEPDVKLNTGVPTSSVTNIKFSNTGQSLACALSNKTSLVFPLPFGQKESSVFVGHDGVVNSLHWSNSGKYLLTSSSDKTANLWDRAGGNVILTFGSIDGNLCSNTSGVKEKSQKKDVYSKEVRGAQFYYMDKFVLIAVGNQLCLYKYHLDPTKDDIRRYLTKSRYKMVKSWDTASQSFTSLSAPNTFYSHLALCACSNRDLEVYDLNAGCLSHTFTDTHSKPVHTVALNEGSTFTSQPQEALNVFATSATLDCIKLWDVRSKRCVLRLEGHTNQAHGCGIAFSACGTYLASGSEDKVAYVYDIRQGTFCQKLRGHTDVVSSVAFNPARPVLATGSINGKLILFKA